MTQNKGSKDEIVERRIRMFEKVFLNKGDNMQMFDDLINEGVEIK